MHVVKRVQCPELAQAYFVLHLVGSEVCARRVLIEVVLLDKRIWRVILPMLSKGSSCTAWYGGSSCHYILFRIIRHVLLHLRTVSLFI